MTAFSNAEILRQYKCKYALMVEKKLAFSSSTNLVREVQNVCLIFKLCEDVLRKGRSILWDTLRIFSRHFSFILVYYQQNFYNILQ